MGADVHEHAAAKMAGDDVELFLLIEDTCIVELRNGVLRVNDEEIDFPPRNERADYLANISVSDVRLRLLGDCHDASESLSWSSSDGSFAAVACLDARRYREALLPIWVVPDQISGATAQICKRFPYVIPDRTVLRPDRVLRNTAVVLERDKRHARTIGLIYPERCRTL